MHVYNYFIISLLSCYSLKSKYKLKTLQGCFQRKCFSPTYKIDKFFIFTSVLIIKSSNRNCFLYDSAEVNYNINYSQKLR